MWGHESGSRRKRGRRGRGRRDGGGRGSCAEEEVELTRVTLEMGGDGSLWHGASSVRALGFAERRGE